MDRAVERGATHVGFIFFEKSPRNIEPDLAGHLADRVRGRAKIVAVTVDADNDELDEIIALVRPDILQFHGKESPERVLTVKAVSGLPVMKAFSIREPDDLKRIEPYIGIADRFLFDAKPPAGSDLPGGNGVSFDWCVLQTLDDSVDYMLSGGLNRDNIAAALRETGARGIDVSSGVESAPGVKDLDKMDEFFAAVERASAREPVSGSAQ
ncbi:N-(5'-phosphoribosyl)anthranilate isomerase [Ciceribacter naphthalenivorans]|uniref:N-(5'-phosphoribosyl)anthranilate isomerase n=2 Tax=Alphaproteobacteria TaxID=28211 RepID=A0A512HMA5_9HYPH|nr:N-(5'-phosphoribosyl)anthranilate isomerase [Ciceribacter naphthalenivorans]GLR20850.1 N-(5'-phosphoribosyl)anthranilate isomerase [Ciceribacter naphthalenivorans]GLT03706.1 N-(5'-phosphoribosyl)anthranilate isomerase [Sphingomonas psychrolutea]